MTGEFRVGKSRVEVKGDASKDVRPRGGESGSMPGLTKAHILNGVPLFGINGVFEQLGEETAEDLQQLRIEAIVGAESDDLLLEERVRGGAGAHAALLVRGCWRLDFDGAMYIVALSFV